METFMKRASNFFKDPEVLQLFEKIAAQILANNVLIIQTKSFVSIYNESLSFESVEEEAHALSNKIDKLVVYTSKFDDDVFICGVFRSGKLVTGGKYGEGLYIYGMKPETMDVKKFCDELNINEINLIQSINASNDISVIENIIEQYLQVPLDIEVSDIQSVSEHYREEFNKNGICIYKRMK